MMLNCRWTSYATVFDNFIVFVVISKAKTTWTLSILSLIRSWLFPVAAEWKTFHGRVVGGNFYTLPNLCEISPEGPSPSCHLGDGFTDLVIVKECSRLQMKSHIQRNFNYKDQVRLVVDTMVYFALLIREFKNV